MAAFLARLLHRVYPKNGIEARQLRQIEYTTGTVNNFGSSTTVTIYAVVTTVTSSDSSTSTTYVTTVPTATSYSTPTPPLTTTFTPPSSCLSGFYNLEDTGWVLGPPFATECLPLGYATTIYYSPGICPSGYLSLTETVNLEPSSNSGIQEFVVTCCPSGYTLGGNIKAYPCTSAFNPSISSSGQLFSPTTTSTFDFTVPDISIGTTTVGSIVVATTNSVDLIVTGTSGYINAQSIQVRWKNGDFSSGSTTYTSSATSAPTSSTPAPPPVLSQGAEIAIGVIVPLVVVGILLATFLLLRAKKRISRYNSGFPRPPPGTEHIAIPGPPPRDGSELEAKTIRPELDSSQNYPKSGSNGVTELPHWQKTPAAMEVDLNISRSAVRSFSDPIPNLGISLPSSTPAYNIHRKPLADPSPSLAVPLDPPITHPASPIPTILRPGIPPSTTLTSSAQPLPQSYNNHSPLPSSEPSMASFPLDGTSQDTSNNLPALQRTYEKVREERERLNKLQELTELEERLRSQIEAQIRGGGDAGS